jgi:hypothetical protein
MLGLFLNTDTPRIQFSKPRDNAVAYGYLTGKKIIFSMLINKNSSHCEWRRVAIAVALLSHAMVWLTIERFTETSRGKRRELIFVVLPFQKIRQIAVAIDSLISNNTIDFGSNPFPIGRKLLTDTPNHLSQLIRDFEDPQIFDKGAKETRKQVRALSDIDLKNLMKKPKGRMYLIFEWWKYSQKSVLNSFTQTDLIQWLNYLPQQASLIQSFLLSLSKTQFLELVCKVDVIPLFVSRQLFGLVASKEELIHDSSTLIRNLVQVICEKFDEERTKWLMHGIASSLEINFSALFLRGIQIEFASYFVNLSTSSLKMLNYGDLEKIFSFNFFKSWKTSDSEQNFYQNLESDTSPSFVEGWKKFCIILDHILRIEAFQKPIRDLALYSEIIALDVVFQLFKQRITSLKEICISTIVNQCLPYKNGAVLLSADLIEEIEMQCPLNQNLKIKIAQLPEEFKRALKNSIQSARTEEELASIANEIAADRFYGVLKLWWLSTRPWMIKKKYFYTFGMKILQKFSSSQLLEANDLHKDSSTNNVFFALWLCPFLSEKERLDSIAQICSNDQIQLDLQIDHAGFFYSEGSQGIIELSERDYWIVLKKITKISTRVMNSTFLIVTLEKDFQRGFPYFQSLDISSQAFHLLLQLNRGKKASQLCYQHLKQTVQIADTWQLVQYLCQNIPEDYHFFYRWLSTAQLRQIMQIIYPTDPLFYDLFAGLPNHPELIQKFLNSLAWMDQYYETKKNLEKLPDYVIPHFLVQFEKMTQ